MYLTARSFDHPKSPTTSCAQAFAAAPTSISLQAAETCSKHNHNHRNGLPPGMTAKNHQRQFVHHDYHDHSLELPDNEVELALFSAHHHDSNDDRSNHDDHQFEGVTIPFPIKLHEMLDKIENDGHSNIISWQPHGRCFLIHNPKNFVNTIIHKYFRQTKLSSFQRQLNLYGFSRLTTGPDKGAYYHELFLRDRPFLIHRMVRTRIKGTGIRTASSPDTEPDFYGMPPMPSIGELIRLKQEGKEYHYQEEQRHPKIRIPDALQSTRRYEGKRRGVLHKDVPIQISPIKSSLLSSSPVPPPSPETKLPFIPIFSSIPSHSAKKIPQITLLSSKTKPIQEETKTTTRKLSPSPIPSPSSTSNKNSQNQNRRWSMGNITDKEQADEDTTPLPIPLSSSSQSISLLSISSNIPDPIPYKRHESSSSFKVEEEDLTPLQFDTAEVDDKCLIDFINNLDFALDCTDLATIEKNNMSSSVGMMLDADIMDDRNLDYLIDQLLD